MPKVELPKGKFAVITDHEEVSEGTYRVIERAMLKTASVRTKVSNAGLDPDEATLAQIYAVLPDADTALLKGYHDALIVGLIEEWDVLPDLPTSETVLKLNRKTYEELARLCSDEFLKEIEEDNPTDPKAEGGN
jgi:hypothetical protein